MTDDVAARYARPRRRGVRALAVTVGSLLVLGLLAVLTQGVLDRDPTWTEVSFTTTQEEARLTFEVYGDEGIVVRCQVRAADARYTDVGQVEVDLGPLPARGLSTTVTIRTVAPAVSASVRTCVQLPDGLS